MQRKGSAIWQGDLKTGKGTVSTDSGVLSQTQYSFSTRFESGKGTNPEELIAAAHAGCFTMALSAQLGSAGLTPDKLETTATVTFDKLEAGWTVTSILAGRERQGPQGGSGRMGQGDTGGQSRLPDLAAPEHHHQHASQAGTLGTAMAKIRSSDSLAFLFDLDGTLIDSVYQHVLAWREATQAAGIELPVWRIHRQIGMSGGLMLNALARETGRKVSQ